MKKNDKKHLQLRKRLADMLKEKRIELGMSQTILGDKAGLTRLCVHNIETNKVWAGMGEFLVLCDAMDLFPTLLGKNRERIEEIKTELKKRQYQ